VSFLGLHQNTKASKPIRGLSPARLTQMAVGAPDSAHTRLARYGNVTMMGVPYARSDTEWSLANVHSYNPLPQQVGRVLNPYSSYHTSSRYLESQ
jgi:hypothetical protein